MQTTIRKALPSDLDALGRLGVLLMETHFAFDRKRFLEPQPDSQKGYAWFLGTRLESKDDCIFVAETDEGIAGYVWAALEPLSWKDLRGPAGFVHDIIVKAELRRSGIATMLMHAAIAWLREHGAPRVLLSTAAPNAAAQALFHRLGFRDTMIEMTFELG